MAVSRAFIRRPFAPADALVTTAHLARIGAALGAIVMLAAITAHVRADRPDEPPALIPVMIFAGRCSIVVRGAGAWSVDSAGPLNPLEEEHAGVPPYEPRDPSAKRDDFALMRDS